MVLGSSGPCRSDIRSVTVRGRSPFSSASPLFQSGARRASLERFTARSTCSTRSQASQVSGGNFGVALGLKCISQCATSCPPHHNAHHNAFLAQPVVAHSHIGPPLTAAVSDSVTSDDQLRAKRHDPPRIEYQTIVCYMKTGHPVSECVVGFDSSVSALATECVE